MLMPKENQNQISTVLRLNVSDNILAGITVFELSVLFQGTEFSEAASSCE